MSNHDWQPFIESPAFPEYVSGHSITSAAAAKLLELYFQKGDYDFQLSLMMNPNNLDPRNYTSFWQAAEEAGISRIYGGIHYSFSNDQGLQAGADLAEYVYGNFMTPVPEPTTLTMLTLAGLCITRKRIKQHASATPAGVAR